MRTNGTVGDLIDALGQYPRETEVVIDNAFDREWCLVDEVRPPYGPGRLSATVALTPGKAITDDE